MLVDHPKTLAFVLLPHRRLTSTIQALEILGFELRNAKVVGPNPEINTILGEPINSDVHQSTFLFFESTEEISRSQLVNVMFSNPKAYACVGREAVELWTYFMSDGRIMDTQAKIMRGEFNQAA